MSTLRDEAYEKLDYLSQLTEIIVAPQDKFLNSIPDRIDIDFTMIRKMAASNYSYSAGEIYFSRSAIINHFCESVLDNNYNYINDIESNFQFEASEDLVVDLENNTMTGTLALVKKTNHLDEKRLLQLAVNSAIRQLDSIGWAQKRLRERVITTLNTLDAGSGDAWAAKVTGRITYQAKESIMFKLKEIILENKWRVRDADVILKIGSWINSYLTEVDNTGLVNLIKLKIMLDKDLPVYSIDEVKNGDPA